MLTGSLVFVVGAVAKARPGGRNHPHEPEGAGLRIWLGRSSLSPGESRRRKPSFPPAAARPLHPSLSSGALT